RLRAADHRTADESRAGVGSTCALSCCLYRIATMRRTAFVLVLLVAVLGLVAAGCGGEENQSAAPETVQGEVTTTETTTSETETTTTGTTTSSESTTTETSGAPPTGDPVAGKAIFTGASGCTGCHTLADAGSSGTVGPNLDD